MSNYGEQFYDDIRESSRHAARIIIPIILDLVGPVGSVIDIGCGNGIWLSVWREHGAVQTTGLDGAHVDRATLEIATEDFIAADLAEPLPLNGRHDLAMTLEVVEHLPQDRAESIVDELVALAPIILFSAAVPGQAGEGHLNVEWQHVWAERFNRRGYQTLDPIRSRIWLDGSISWWYQQNILVFAAEDAMAANPRLVAEARRLDPARLSVVHPRAFNKVYNLAVENYRERVKLMDEVTRLREQLSALTDAPKD
jgi:hypothetical protein